MLKLSSEKKRVHCDGCGQFQPVMTRGVGAATLVCSACLHVISDKKTDVDAAYELGLVKGHISSTDFRRPAKNAHAEKVLPKPQTETRPAGTEGTR